MPASKIYLMDRLLAQRFWISFLGAQISQFVSCYFSVTSEGYSWTANSSNCTLSAWIISKIFISSDEFQWSCYNLCHATFLSHQNDTHELKTVPPVLSLHGSANFLSAVMNAIGHVTICVMTDHPNELWTVLNCILHLCGSVTKLLWAILNSFCHVTICIISNCLHDLWPVLNCIFHVWISGQIFRTRVGIPLVMSQFASHLNHPHGLWTVLTVYPLCMGRWLQF